ncbi:Hypothetical protein A7982_01073 [Minicystis rosea]|nr:Hypothetical protein A7982_01073 [Minicystis rosea]
MPAGAQTAPSGEAAFVDVEGTVLAIQGDEIVLDLGADRGASAGAVAAIWRPVKLKHPVTGRVLSDRFRIGAVELVQVQKTLTLARASGTLSRPAETGDVVVLSALAPAPRRAVPAPRPAAPQAAAARPAVEENVKVPDDPDARAVNEMFEALRGTDPAARADRYERYARERPESRFAVVLSEEAGALRELLGHRLRAQAKESVPRVVLAVPEVRNFTPPAEVQAGARVRFAIELSDGAQGAVIHLRRRGNESYDSIPMRAIGGGYYVAEIPSARVTAGSIQYFIEAVSGNRALAVVGDAGSPREMDVADTPRPHAPTRPPMRIDLLSDFADYNRMRGNDHVIQTEGSFGVRLGDTGIRAVRLGFGVYRGVGGSIEDLDKKGLDPRHVGLTYGYLETEIGIVRAFSLLARGSVGLIDSGVSGGGQAGLRIGSDLKTNLVLGAEILGGVGARGYAQLELATFDRVPMLLRTEVTNQPAGVTPSAGDANTSGGAGQIGGRGIVQVGFKILPELVVSVRGSFQGRTIQHAGPGFGGAVSFVW